ncbi:hypothetical protein GCM10008908_36880 [Clostridium subterminale]|uniref:Uncharacterized protein n=1 Tax=Clostridium subterminale TaxID=1550 RepID=A0ABN1KYA7_CLOSU
MTKLILIIGIDMTCRDNNLIQLTGMIDKAIRDEKSKLKGVRYEVIKLS